MLNFLDMVRDVLPPTKTYHLRELLFVPGDGDDGLGRLTLKLQHRLGVHRAFDLDSYRIDRDTAEPNDNGGAAFFLENLTDQDAAEVYRCVVGGLNALPRCNCKAGKCRVPADENSDGCKHRDAIQHLIEAGYIAV